MKKKFLYILLHLFLIAVSCVAQPAKLTDKDLKEWVERYMDNAVRFDHFSGVVWVTREGRPVFTRAYGMADYELGVPNTLDTKFRIGSVSKTFTAAAIHKLEQEGKLHSDSAISLYLKECPPQWGNVKVRHLLEHTSGIVSFTGLPEASGNFLLLEHSRKEILDLFRAKALESVPGEQFSYNNSGYFLLGLIVENLSGLTLERYLESHFLKPFRLLQTGTDTRAALIPLRAHGYQQVSDSSFANTYVMDMSNAFAIGGLYSTAKDLQTWIEQFRNDGRFGAAVQRARSAGNPVSPYGLGWVLDTLGKAPRIYHDGGITDFSASVQLVGGYTIIALCNKGEDGGIKVAYDIAGKLFCYPATVRGMQDELESLDSDKLVDLINKSREAFPHFLINEQLVQQVAEDLLRQKQVQQSLELRVLNTRLYPESETTWLRLGEAYLHNKQKEKAVSCFSQCLSINPGNEQARKYLGK